MRNFEPWDANVLRAVAETYRYDPVTGHITHVRRPGKSLGTIGNDKSVALSMYYVHGEKKFKIISGHRVAVYLHTGKQPDNITFIDGNRANLKWSNLRISGSGFPSVAAAPDKSEESVVYEELRNMALNPGRKHALARGGMRVDEELPEKVMEMTPIECFRWARTDRFLLSTTENPAKFLSSAVFAERYAIPVKIEAIVSQTVSQQTEILVELAEEQEAPTKVRPINWTPEITNEEFQAMTQEERDIRNARLSLNVGRGLTKREHRRWKADNAKAGKYTVNWEQFEEIIKYLPE